MKYPTLWKIAAIIASHAWFTPALAAPARPSAAKSYTVKSGDTFAKIARSHGVSLGELLKANRLSNPDHIELGQRMQIPGAKGAPKMTTTAKPAAKKTSTSKAIKTAPTLAGSRPQAKEKVSPGMKERDSTTVDITPPPPLPGSLYVVQSGDSLSRIQRRTGTPMTSLMKLNALTATSIIRPGQKLRLGTIAVAAKGKAAAPAKPQPAPLREMDTPYVQEPDPVVTEPSPPGVPAEIPADQQPVTAPSAPPPPSITAPHKIESGETFSSVGRLYGVSRSKLVAANPRVNPDRLRIGQTLMIPGQPARPKAQPLVVRADGRILANRPDPFADDAPVSDAVPAARTRTGYLVEEGETLTQIAQRFHTSERELRRLNRLGDSDNIYAGRYILVPFIRQAPGPPAYAHRDA